MRHCLSLEMGIAGVSIHSRETYLVFELGTGYVKCIPEEKAGDVVLQGTHVWRYEVERCPDQLPTPTVCELEGCCTTGGHQETFRSLSKCRKRRKATKSGGKCTEAHFPKPGSTSQK